VITRHRFSLSQRLLVTLFVVSFAYWAVIAWLTIRDSVDQVYELFDAHLAQTALALLRVSDPDDIVPYAIPNSTESPPLKEIFSLWPDLSERLARARSAFGSTTRQTDSVVPVASGTANPGTFHLLQQEYEKKLRYQIWNSEGQLLLRSANSPEIPLAGEDGFSETKDGEGRVWRHYSVWDMHHHVRVVVSEAHDIRNRLVQRIALHQASPLALGLPVLLLLLWISISRGLDPLGVLTREIEQRKADNLQPLDAGSAPVEVRPMVLSLNRLLLRFTDSLENERRFTANAAHELRTPLAVIQVQLHMVRTAESDAERLRAMDQLQRGVERGIRLVEQLLNLARLDPEQSLPDVQPIKLGIMAEAVCAELAPLALQREQVLELQVDPDLPLLLGNVDMLSMLLGNLIDNAVRYTPLQGHINVAIRQNEATLLIEVSDNGSGIPASQRERVFECFYRCTRHNQPGTGLGLAICRRIANLHKAQIAITDGPGGQGLTVNVILPATPALE